MLILGAPGGATMPGSSVSSPGIRRYPDDSRPGRCGSCGNRPGSAIGVGTLNWPLNARLSSGTAGASGPTWRGGTRRPPNLFDVRDADDFFEARPADRQAT